MDHAPTGHIKATLIKFILLPTLPPSTIITLDRNFKFQLPRALKFKSALFGSDPLKLRGMKVDLLI